MNIEKLKEYFESLQRQNWEIPGDLKLMYEEAEGKEINLKKAIEGKITLEEMYKLAQNVGKEKVKTQAMKLILEQYDKAKRWVDNVHDTKDKWVSIKTLQRMINDSKSLQITSHLIEEVKKRYDKAHDWYNFIL
jgi:hypothetical protein